MTEYINYADMLIQLKNGKKARLSYWHKNLYLSMDNFIIYEHEKLTDDLEKICIFEPRGINENWEIIE